MRSWRAALRLHTRTAKNAAKLSLMLLANLMHECPLADLVAAAAHLNADLVQEGANAGAHVHAARVLGHVFGQRNLQRSLRGRSAKARRHVQRLQPDVITRQHLRRPSPRPLVPAESP